jgi:hypothetical protein
MVVETGAAPASGVWLEDEDKVVIRGLAKRALLWRIAPMLDVAAVEVRLAGYTYP